MRALAKYSIDECGHSLARGMRKCSKNFELPGSCEEECPKVTNGECPDCQRGRRLKSPRRRKVALWMLGGRRPDRYNRVANGNDGGSERSASSGMSSKNEESEGTGQSGATSPDEEDIDGGVERATEEAQRSRESVQTPAEELSEIRSTRPKGARNITSPRGIRADSFVARFSITGSHAGD